MSKMQHSRLHWEVHALAEVLAETQTQHSHKLTTCAEVEVLAQKLWGPAVSVAHHGSTYTGTSLQGGDLDIIILGVKDIPAPDNTGSNGYLPQSRSIVVNYLESLQKILGEETTLVHDIDIVRKARMPVLRGKIECGLELKITLSPLDVGDIPALKTADFISSTLKELPHARKLLLVMKALMRSPNCLGTFNGVHTGGISSFTMTLMVIGFCKFQASKMNTVNLDLGSLFLSFLQFYSDRSLFDIARHSIDVVVPSGFTQKAEAQAHLDPSARHMLSEHLCVLEPSSRHDIGQSSYRIKNMLGTLGGLRVHLTHLNPFLLPPEADVGQLRAVSSPRSYRSALTPRESSSGPEPRLSSSWIHRYLPIMNSIIDMSSFVTITDEALNESPKANAPPKQQFPPGSVFVPGYGAMTLGQASMLSAQEVPLMGPHGHLRPESFPTLKESAEMTSRSPQARSSPKASNHMAASNDFLPDKHYHTHGARDFRRGPKPTARGNGHVEPHARAYISHKRAESNKADLTSSDEVRSKSGKIPSADNSPRKHEVPAEDLSVQEAHHADRNGKSDKMYNSGATLDMCSQTMGSTSSTTMALSMRSKSIGTTSSTALSPMVLSSSPRALNATQDVAVLPSAKEELVEDMSSDVSCSKQKNESPRKETETEQNTGKKKSCAHSPRYDRSSTQGPRQAAPWANRGRRKAPARGTAGQGQNGMGYISHWNSQNHVHHWAPNASQPRASGGHHVQMVPFPVYPAYPGHHLPYGMVPAATQVPAAKPEAPSSGAPLKSESESAHTTTEAESCPPKDQANTSPHPPQASAQMVLVQNPYVHQRPLPAANGSAQAWPYNMPTSAGIPANGMPFMYVALPAQQLPLSGPAILNHQNGGTTHGHSSQNMNKGKTNVNRNYLPRGNRQGFEGFTGRGRGGQGRGWQQGRRPIATSSRAPAGRWRGESAV